MTEQELKTLPIAPADNAAMEKARQRQAELAKPPGSLENWRTTPSGWRESREK